MKFKVTRKTAYILLLLAAAAALLCGLLALAGVGYTLPLAAEVCATGLALLCLAAQKDGPSGESGAYIFILLALACSCILSGWEGDVCAAAVWPMLLHVETKSGRPVQRQMRLVNVGEALHLLLQLAVSCGGLTGLLFWANALWVLLAGARGWAAVVLCKEQKETV